MRDGILSTDAYQLTMAQVYWRHGLHDRRVRFEHFFRSYPDYGTHQAGYCVAAGLGPFARWMTATRATPPTSTRSAPIGRPAGGRCSTTTSAPGSPAPTSAASALEAVPEGRVVHPNTPITVVEGPLAAAQLLETPLLNQLNFATLIATKASRILDAARGRPGARVRDAPGGRCGADAASRSAIVGGAASTSNAAVAYELGRTPSGTHAHSLVQLFLALGDGEAAAFDAYADVYPDDCVLLVDTVDTLDSGIPNAIATFERLRRRGHDRSGFGSTPATWRTSPCRRRSPSTPPGSTTPRSCSRASSTS